MNMEIHGKGGFHGSDTAQGEERRSIPRIISWNTTFCCNLKCSHCYLDAQDRRNLDELDTKEGKLVLDQIAEVSKPF